MLLDRLLTNLSVEVRPFALCHVSNGWRMRLPPPPVPLLHFVLEGEGAVSGASGEPVPVRPSSFIVVPVGINHALESLGPIEHERRIALGPAESTVCHFTAGPEIPEGLVVACGLLNVRYGPVLDLFEHAKDILPADLSGVPLVGAAFKGILVEQAGMAPGSAAMTKALMNQCLVHFFRQIGASGSLPWLDALDDPRLGRALDSMLEDPSARHTVASLAEEASMSRSTFAAGFADAFGRPPMELLHHVRMQHAALLLRQNDSLSLDEVASRSGYSSRSHFSAAFREHHDAWPAEFRAAAD